MLDFLYTTERKRRKKIIIFTFVIYIYFVWLSYWNPEWQELERHLLDWDSTLQRLRKITPSVPYSADAITPVLPSQFSRARHNNVATYSAFCPISGFPQEGARSFRAVPRGPVIPSEDDTIKIAMLTSAVLRDASGGTGCRRTIVQKREAAGDGGGGEGEG